MVVVPEPSVKGLCSFVAGVVDRAVGPAAQQGADEPFGFAVGLGPVGAGAEVADSHSAARDRVDRGAVSGTIVGEQLLQRDPVPGVEVPRSLEEADNSGRLL